jgi:dihydropteroate synthase
MFTLNCKGRLLPVDKPLVMGIINITPDSFYEGSRYHDTGSILSIAEKMLKDGATILDIGGQSTRPGSVSLSEEEELQRVISPLNAICRNFPEAIVSVDTFYSRVVEEAVAAGASIVNDISAGSMDNRMFPVVASLRVPYILMHMKGTPATMQQQPQYENVVREVLDFFIGRIAFLQQSGVHDIIIDPGFGFGKSIAHNFELLRNLSVFSITGKPLLAGLSRKSTIYKTLGIPVEDALNGSTVLQTMALMNGASLLRVHDVKEAVEAVKLFQAYNDDSK